METSLIPICCAALDSTCVDTLGSVCVRETKTDRQRQEQKIQNDKKEARGASVVSGHSLSLTKGSLNSPARFGL